MRYAWTLPEFSEGRPAGADVSTRRTRAGVGVVAGDHELDVVTRSTEIGGLPAHVIEPPVAVGSIVHLHGGGFRAGSASDWCNFGRRLAATTSTMVVLPDYPLAPECPFPAALHSLAQLYEELLDEVPSVILAGDSAGGNLATALTVSCREASAPAPAGLILISPWLDLTVSARSYAALAETDLLFSAASARDAVELYLQGRHNAIHPLASPLFAEVTDFPPVLLFAGTDEVLLDDALTFASRLARAGISVESHIVAGMQHEWPVQSPELIESEWALRDIARFVGRVLQIEPEALER